MTEGDAFDVFRTQANRDLKAIIERYTDQIIFSCPSYLEMYLARLFDVKILGKFEFVSLASFRKCKPAGDVFVITPSDMECVESICEVFETIPNRKTLLVIPRVTEFVRQAADNHHFQVISSLDELWAPLHQVIAKEFHADFLFTDVDFFLLPCTHTFYHTAIQKDFSDLFAAARSLAKIQTVFGGIPHVVTVGESAAMVKTLMDGIMDQTGCSSTDVPQIGSLIIIDRAVDLVTPLMMPTSIEGRMDEYFGIKYGVFKLDVKLEDGPTDRSCDDVVLGERHQAFKQVRCMGDDAYRELAARWSRESAEKWQRLKEGGSSLEEWGNIVIELRSRLDVTEQVRACVLMIMEKDTDLFQRAMLAIPQWDLILNGTSVLPLAMSYVTMLGDWETALKLIYLETFAKGPKSVPMEGIIKALAAEFDLNAMETIATMAKVRQLPPVANCTHAAAKWNLDCFEESKMGALCDKFIPVSVQIVRKITAGSTAIKGIDVSSVGEDTVKDTSSDNRRVLVFFVGGITLSEAGYIRALSSVVFENRVSYIIGATNQLSSRTFIEELRPGLFDS